MENNTAHDIFGEQAHFVRILNEICSDVRVTRYSFMSKSQYETLVQSDLPAAMQVYWREILYRAHFSGFASLLRSQRWASGILSAAHSSNLLTFAACFRGFLESCADTHDSLAEIAYVLADNRSTIQSALKRKLRFMVLAPGLEDRLIHFTHARKVRKGEQSPDSHTAKTAAAYLESLRRENDTSISECYAHLCEYTHPAISSVMCFAKVNEAGTEYALDSTPDSVLIADFCRRYSAIMPGVVSMGISPALAMLAILNKFELRTLHTPYVHSIDMNSWEAWREIMNRYKESKRIAIR